MPGAIFIDSFVQGLYVVRSETGKQSVYFEDSDVFGPSKSDPRTQEVDPVPDKHWFWRFYTPWRLAGRPVSDDPPTPGGYARAKWAS